MESISNLLKKISGISVMALVGESGTGKSFKSKLLAQKYGIDAIIDDGLLIQNDKILGGRSALMYAIIRMSSLNMMRRC